MSEKQTRLGFEILLIILGCAGLITANVTNWASVNYTSIGLIIAGLIGASFSKYYSLKQ